MKKQPLGFFSTLGSFVGPEALDAAIPNKYKPKEEKECLLPECNNTTTHNGGYCCAEHCKEHRRQLKEKEK